jgi:replication-associated recombination protein RarA
MLATTFSINDNRLYQGLNYARKFLNDLYDGRYNGMMLWGPPGIGKTLIARETAKERGIKAFEPRPGTARGLLQVL